MPPRFWGMSRSPSRQDRSGCARPVESAYDQPLSHRAGHRRPAGPHELNENVHRRNQTNDDHQHAQRRRQAPIRERVRQPPAGQPPRDKPSTHASSDREPPNTGDHRRRSTHALFNRPADRPRGREHRDATLADFAAKTVVRSCRCVHRLRARRAPSRSSRNSSRVGAPRRAVPQELRRGRPSCPR